MMNRRTRTDGQTDLLVRSIQQSRFLIHLTPYADVVLFLRRRVRETRERDEITRREGTEANIGI
jgi:hypothetical protein